MKNYQAIKPNNGKKEWLINGDSLVVVRDGIDLFLPAFLLFEFIIAYC